MSSNRKIDNVESAIYLIRGQRVMLDSDLAAIYGTSTMRLNEQLRRNLPIVFGEHAGMWERPQRRDLVPKLIGALRPLPHF